MENGCLNTPSNLPKTTRKKLAGVTTSKADWYAGLENCLRNGWLRIVDQRAIDEIQELLRTAPALVPVPDEVIRYPGTVDFTPGGAALYRMISAEWLGAGWEDEIEVWREYYREEHRYCETKEGLRKITEEYELSREDVRESKIVPIDAWCVYWWKRFPRGYRLEMKIGDLETV